MIIKNKNISSFLLTAMFTFMFCLASSVSIFAAVDVYLDGVPLSYSDAQPQIINDRTMVPLRETAYHFNMTPTWDAATKTMVFTGNGRTIIHTIYDNKIYVNGTAVEFDFSSVIVNDRTLMPIRMLAEAIGCAVEWDTHGSDIVVDIWTDTTDYSAPPAQNQDDPNPSTPSVPEPAKIPASTDSITIYAVAQDRTIIEAGQTLRISVDTNKMATMVKVTDFDGNLLREVTDYEENDQGRVFNISITPEELGEVSLKIYAGNDGNYSLASKNITVIVNGVVKNIFIESIKLSSKSVEPGRDIDLVFYTSKNVKRVIISDDQGVVKRLSNRSDVTSNYYIWKTFLYAENKVGEYTYTITAYDEDDVSESADFILSVKAASASNSANTIIQKVDYEKADAGARCYITVTTNNTVDELKMRDRHNDLVRSISADRAEVSGSQLIWTFFILPEDNDNYYLYAFDRYGEEIDSKTVYIEVK